jgi:hypothetical protein
LLTLVRLMVVAWSLQEAVSAGVGKLGVSMVAVEGNLAQGEAVLADST